MPETDAARLRVLNRGKRMEPYILDMIRDEHGVNVIAANERYTDQAVDYFACEIDAEAQDEMRGHINIEIKTVHPFKVKEWGEELTDALPLHYLAQVQWGLGITRRQHCDVYALIGDDLKRYAVEADGELIATLREKAIQFWVRYVAALRASASVSIGADWPLSAGCRR
jgi:predicted phage-related endonuclease